MIAMRSHAVSAARFCLTRRYEVRGSIAWESPMKRVRTSRQRYEAFRQDYKERRQDELSVAGDDDKPEPAGKQERRRYLANYANWLRPYAGGVAILLFLALLEAGLDMLPPLFLRHVVDHVLLVQGLPAEGRLSTLHRVGALFLAAIVIAR